MNKTTLGLGAVVAALAGGVMFCSDALDEPTGTIAHNDENTSPTNETEPSPDATTKAFKLELTVATEDSSRPDFVAFKDGENGWRHPSIDADTVTLEVYDARQRYTLLTACDFEDDKGQRHIDLTLVEATVSELSRPRLICRDASADEQAVHVAGAVRDAGGQDVEILVGSRRFLVENKDQGKDVAFATDVSKGRHTFVAMQGTGEKAKVAAARGVEFTDTKGTVEIDMTDTIQRVATNLSFYTNSTTYFSGGRSFLWMDGRTRLTPSPIRAIADGDGWNLTTSSTTNPTDTLDLTAQFRTALPLTDGDPQPVAAQMRILTSAKDIGEIVVPSLNWAVPSEVRLHNTSVDIGWNPDNWTVFGYKPDGKLALFMPTAYVARITQQTNARRTLDVVVTPSRASGPEPFYSVPNFNEIEHFNTEWGFRPSNDLLAKAGNLTAHAGAEKVFADEVIAAYLESDAVHGPATYLTSRTLTTLVTGLPPTIVDATTEIPAAHQERCQAASECIQKVADSALALADCQALQTYRWCEGIDRGESFKAKPADFANDLKREIVKWYFYQDVEFGENARSRDEALAAISVDNVRQMKPLEFGEYFSYDLSKYQVFYHVDPIYEDSRAVWYGAYALGQLIEVTPVNLEYTVNSFPTKEQLENMRLTSGPQQPLIELDKAVIKDAWVAPLPPAAME